MSARLSSEEITAILRGEGTGPADGASLGATVGRLRAAYERSPQASPVLTAFLEGESSPTAAQPAIGSPPERAARTQPRRGRRIVRWVTAIGLTGQVALGSAVAVAATTGAGLAERLPGPAQAAFEELVDAIVPPEAAEVPGSGGLPPTEVRPPAPADAEESHVDRDTSTTVTSVGDGDDKPGRKPRRARERREPTAAASGTQSGATTTGAEQPSSLTPRQEDAGPTRHARDARDRQRDAADDARDRQEDAADDARDRQEDAADDARDRQEDAAEPSDPTDPPDPADGDVEDGGD